MNAMNLMSLASKIHDQFLPYVTDTRFTPHATLMKVKWEGSKSKGKIKTVPDDVWKAFRGIAFENAVRHVNSLCSRS